jgi:hypothetical protein
LAGRRKGFQPGFDRGTKTALRGGHHKDVIVSQGMLQHRRRVIAGPCINANGGVCRTSLVRQRRQSPGQIAPAVVGNHDGGNVYFLQN